MNPIVLSPTTLMRTPALEFIDIAQKAGYDGVGIRLYPSPNMHFNPVLGDAALERDLRKAIADSDLKVYDVFTFYLQPEMDFEAMKRAQEYGASLGAAYALVIGDDPEWNRMLDNFGRLCDMAKQFSLTCAFDAPVNIRVLNKVDLILNLIRESGRENAAICLDPAQFYRAGEGPDLLRNVEPRLMPYAMLSDATTMTPMGRYCMPGDGFVPLAEILDVLPADVPLSVHYHHSDDRYTELAWATHVLDGTRRFLRSNHDSKQAANTPEKG
jgi:sugar phosphate isomerase/epimerase